MVEDIINQEPFVGYLEWRVGEGLPWDGPLVPSVGAGACGWQTGGGSEPQSGPATPGLLWFGEMEEHFAECQRLLHQPIYPLEQQLYWMMT
jgi:hypothetical protein